MAVLIRRHLLVGLELERGKPLDVLPLISLRAVLKSRCPRCGQGAMYRSIIALKPQCTHCALPFARADVGDGPAFFAIMLVGFLVTTLAAWVEIAYAPTYLLHALLWLPLTLMLSVLVIRVSKAYLVHAAYRFERL